MSSLKSPASSTRSSFDQNHSSANTSSAARAEAREARRNRSALRDYYNLASSTSASSSTTNVAASNISQSDDTAAIAPQRRQSALLDPLDDDNFNGPAYVHELLSKGALTDVLRVQVALAQETRGLDGERKGLVYDNYGRLIGARDVVQNVGQYLLPAEGDTEASATPNNGQENVDRVKGYVEELGPKVEGLALKMPRNSTDDDNKAQDVKRQKQKDTVKWVLAAPIRVEELLRKGKVDEAKTLQATAEALLDDWREVDGVQDVRSRLIAASQLTGQSSHVLV